MVFSRNKAQETLPQGEAKQQAIREMFDTIASRYDFVNRVMTFRLDTKWRKIAIEALQLSAPSRVLDLASGTGDLCIPIQKLGHTAISVDLSYGMLSYDRSGAPRTQADILRLPFPNSSIDAVICGFALRNLVDLSTFFVEIARVLKPGGRVVLLDVDVTPELEAEGSARDIVRAVQQARREADLDISDRIIVTLSVDDEMKSQILPHVGLIAGETLAIEVLFDASGERAVSVEGALIGVSVAVAS